MVQIVGGGECNMLYLIPILTMQEVNMIYGHGPDDVICKHRISK
jgi:hypothetical protein